MGGTRLDQKLLVRIAEKTGRSVKSVRESVSRLASKKGIPSEAALLVLAHGLGFGIARSLRKLPPPLQQQVTAALETSTSRPTVSDAGSSTVQKTAHPDPVASAIECLLTDEELRKRCSDLLKKKRYLDRAVREAITLLEDRLRERTGLGKAQEKGRKGLVAKALHPDQAQIIVSQDRDIQEGVFFICSGLMEAFGGPVHHSLRDDVTQQEALAVCGAVNLILTLIDKGTIRQGVAAGSEDSLAIQKHEDRKRTPSKA